MDLSVIAERENVHFQSSLHGSILFLVCIKTASLDVTLLPKPKHDRS